MSVEFFCGMIAGVFGTFGVIACLLLHEFALFIKPKGKGK